MHVQRSRVGYFNSPNTLIPTYLAQQVGSHHEACEVICLLLCWALCGDDGVIKCNEEDAMPRVKSDEEL